MREIAADVWTFDGEAVNFHSFPFTTRMTVIVLPEGGLWVHSPIKLEQELKAEVDALGKVQYLIAPNSLHHLFIEEWHQAYPDAQLFGTDEVRKKRKDITFEGTLTSSAKTPWEAEIDQLLFTGSRAMEECVFFHNKSKVLIVTDLIENFSPEAFTPFKRRLAKYTGILAPHGKMPIDWRLSFFFSKSEARGHIEKILKWRPEKIILSHGLIIEDKAEEFLRKSFDWLKPGQTTT